MALVPPRCMPSTTMMRGRITRDALAEKCGRNAAFFHPSIYSRPFMDATLTIGELQRWAGSWVLLELRARVAAGRTAWPCLQLDCGAGFSPLRSRALPPVSAATPAVEHVLFLPRELRQARIASLAGAPLEAEALRFTRLSKYAASLRMLARVTPADGPGPGR